MESDKKKPLMDQPAGVESANLWPSGDVVDRPVSELYGPKGLEPTRYGDWEQKGRCTDF